MLRRSFMATLPVGAHLLRNKGATYAQVLEKHDYTGIGFPMPRCDLAAL